MQFDWSELAFSSKKPVRELSAVFIAAPRELSKARFTQLVKEYLPHANIILGLAKEAYIDGFNNQLQFKTLQYKTVQPIVEKVNTSNSKHKIYTLSYFQRELPFILEKLTPQKALFINGSWQRSFHTRPEFYTLVNAHIPYRLISPFVDEAEARAYAVQVERPLPHPTDLLSETEMLALANDAAACSFDYGFQTGVALGKKQGKRFKVLATACNNVVPFQTYAMHNGASRETHFSPPNDLNYYDTVHAEVAMLVKAQKLGLSLAGATLFINLLPCPTCARMLAETDITEYVYQTDHSSGYAIKMLELGGKKIRRIVE